MKNLITRLFPLYCSVAMLVLAGHSGLSFAAEDFAIDAPEFSADIPQWRLAPGTNSQFRMQPATADSPPTLQLKPGGALLGLNSQPFEIGGKIQADSAYTVQAQVNNGGLSQGVFAFSLYCYDATNQPLKQIVLGSLNTNSPTDSWRRMLGRFGPGTKNVLPPETKSVRFRFSFYEADGNCVGDVQIRDVKYEPSETPGNADWPAEIVANVGDLQIRFESRSFWTLYRIDYKGTRICKDRFGSHYGSVALFPEIGFIGSGHTENADEKITELSLLVDDQPIAQPQAKITGQKVELYKTSQLKSLQLRTTILVAGNMITESVHLSASEPTPVKLVYHFMHPWIPAAKFYCAETLDGQFLSGEFDGDKRQEVDRPTRWSAIYDPTSQTGAVTCVIQAPAQAGHWRTRYWDIDDVYRKHYFVTFMNQTIPADETFSYQIKTIPFQAESDDWQQSAQKTADGVFRPKP